MRSAVAGGQRRACRPSAGRTSSPLADRLAVLLDPGTWVEDGLLANATAAGHPADGVRTGVGRIDGRPVAVIAHDFAVKAGSWGRLTCEKQMRILERADRDLLPVIYLVDSAGGRLTDQLGFFSDRRGASRIFQLQVALSGRVPQLCCLLGPSAAGGAYMPAFTDWVGMVEGNASMYLASPRVAEKVTGERTTLEEMGGAAMHASVSGCGDEVFGSDWEAISAARLLLSYLPDSWQQRPSTRDPVAPARQDWAGVIPAEESVGYDVNEVIDRLVDAGTFFEIKARWAAELVTGFARLEGRVIGVVANQPQVRSGAIFVDSADKAARFITLCDAFNIPLLFLHDVPGFMVGAAVERQGIIRHGAKMITAMASAAVPKFSGHPAQVLRRRLLRHVRPRLRAARLARAADRDHRPDGGGGVGQRHVRQEDRRDHRPRRTRPLRAGAHRRAAGRHRPAAAVRRAGRRRRGRAAGPARRPRRPARRRRRLEPRPAAPPPPRQSGLSTPAQIAGPRSEGTA